MAEIEGVSDEEARRQMDVLFWGPFHVIKEARHSFHTSL